MSKATFHNSNPVDMTNRGTTPQAIPTRPDSAHSLSACAAGDVSVCEWRIRGRVRTVAGAILLCLHIGIDPPDVIKPSQSATLHFWTDTKTRSDSAEEIQAIRDTIQQAAVRQFEFWQPRAKWRTLFDPTVDSLRKLLSSLRRHARDERLMLYYNGHGVPRITAMGELWFFNKEYTQYVPLSVADVVSMAQTPLLLIVEASNAQRILASLPPSCFSPSSQTTDGSSQSSKKQSSAFAFHNTCPVIVLGACGPEETLPMAPEVPADLFTSCLTSPLETAIQFHIYRSGPLLAQSALEQAAANVIRSIPGRIDDRKTLLGELNWILTAITDTITWSLLDHAQFKALYRQDVLVASLMRNYLLAVRVMNSFYCRPFCMPAIALDTCAILSHPLWSSWDYILDTVINSHFEEEKTESLPTAKEEDFVVGGIGRVFYALQMDAFERWVLAQRDAVVEVFGDEEDCKFPLHRIDWGVESTAAHFASTTRPSTPLDPNDPHIHHHASPDNLADSMQDLLLNDLKRTQNHPFRRAAIEECPLLPMLLQILLSQAQRTRAVHLLAEYISLGASAVIDALHVGIHPYVTKLLHSSVRADLLRIWTAILAVDASVAADLCRDQTSATYIHLAAPFINVNSNDSDNPPTIQCMTYSLASVSLLLLHSTSQTHSASIDIGTFLIPLVDSVVSHYAILSSDVGAMQWSLRLLQSVACFCALLPKSTINAHAAVFRPNKRMAVADFLNEAMRCKSPMVRVAALDCWALTVLAGDDADVEHGVALVLVWAASDAHWKVRLAAARLLNRMIKLHRSRFLAVAFTTINNANRMAKLDRVVVPSGGGDFVRQASTCTLLWRILLVLSMDCNPSVSQLSQSAVDDLHYQVLSNHNDLTLDEDQDPKTNHLLYNASHLFDLTSLTEKVTCAAMDLFWEHSRESSDLLSASNKISSMDLSTEPSISMDYDQHVVQFKSLFTSDFITWSVDHTDRLLAVSSIDRSLVRLNISTSISTEATPFRLHRSLQYLNSNSHFSTAVDDRCCLIIANSAYNTPITCMSDPLHCASSVHGYSLLDHRLIIADDQGHSAILDAQSSMVTTIRQPWSSTCLTDTHWFSDCFSAGPQGIARLDHRINVSWQSLDIQRNSFVDLFLQQSKPHSLFALIKRNVSSTDNLTLQEFDLRKIDQILFEHQFSNGLVAMHPRLPFLAHSQRDHLELFTWISGRLVTIGTESYSSSLTFPSVLYFGPDQSLIFDRRRISIFI